jgi:hypothetical protein
MIWSEVVMKRSAPATIVTPPFSKVPSSGSYSWTIWEISRVFICLKDFPSASLPKMCAMLASELGHAILDLGASLGGR